MYEQSEYCALINRQINEINHKINHIVDECDCMQVGMMQSGEAATAANQAQMRATRNIYYTLSYTLCLHFITWSDNQFEFLLYGYGYAIIFSSLAFQLPLLAIYMSSFINPIIYTMKYEQFRKAILSAFPCVRRFDAEAQSSHSSKTNNVLLTATTHRAPLETY